MKRLPLPAPPARGLDASPVQVDDTLGECQADAQPTGGVILGRTYLREHAEHLRQVLAGETDAVVFDADRQLAILDARLHANGTLRIGVLGGVGQQVGKYLREPQGIAEHLQVAGHVNVETVAALVDERTRGLDGSTDH